MQKKLTYINFRLPYRIRDSETFSMLRAVVRQGCRCGYLGSYPIRFAAQVSCSSHRPHSLVLHLESQGSPCTYCRIKPITPPNGFSLGSFHTLLSEKALIDALLRRHRHSAGDLKLIIAVASTSHDTIASYHSQPTTKCRIKAQQYITAGRPENADIKLIGTKPRVVTYYFDHNREAKERRTPATPPICESPAMFPLHNCAVAHVQTGSNSPRSWLIPHTQAFR